MLRQDIITLLKLSCNTATRKTKKITFESVNKMLYGVTIQVKLLWQNFCTVRPLSKDITKLNLNIFVNFFFSQ